MAYPTEGMKDLKKYLVVRADAINRILAGPPATFTPSVFHKLRVEIKKLRALIELIEFCVKDFKKVKAFKPFREIFRQAGKVREIQIEEAMLRPYFRQELLSGYGKKLRVHRLYERQVFLRLIDQSTKDRLQSTFLKITPFITQITEHQSVAFISRKREALHKFIRQPDLGTIQLHDLRKRLKSYNYNRKVVEPFLEEPGWTENTGFSDLLGKWHDSDQICRHLENAQAEGALETTEQARLEDIKTIIASNRQELLEKINSIIHCSDLK